VAVADVAVADVAVADVAVAASVQTDASSVGHENLIQPKLIKIVFVVHCRRSRLLFL
jgi:hypothetical protein